MARGEEGTHISGYTSCASQYSFSASVCHRMLPLFTTSHPMAPYFCFFRSKSSNFCKSQWKLDKIIIIIIIIIIIAQILCNFTPNEPFFARKLLLIAPRFDASVGAPLSLLYVSFPPPPLRVQWQSNDKLCNYFSSILWVLPLLFIGCPNDAAPIQLWHRRFLMGMKN